MTSWIGEEWYLGRERSKGVGEEGLDRLDGS